MKVFDMSQWIRSKNDYGAVCPVFRREFSLDEMPESAILHITAMGVYEAELNGERVGDFIMAPGWTSYEKRHQYQSYDVTKMLKKENTLCVTVGKGWYRGELIEWRDKDVWGAHSAIIAELELVFPDGTRSTVPSDPVWEVSESAIRFSEIYDGEVYDARFLPKFWEKAVCLHAQKDNLIPQESEPVREHECFLPQAVFTAPNGETIIDFGQNLTGYVAFDIDAANGERLIYTHAEVLDRDGNFYTENLRSAKQRIEYICCDGRQTYRPHHCFMGFRYICLKECPKNFDPMNMKAIAVHTDMRRTGHFSCSNEKLNKLYENVIWGQKDNFLDVPTDCPQRDERLGWCGDAQMFAETACYNFDVRLFFKKWLRDLAASQDADGGVPIVVPNVFNRVIAPPRAAWGDAAVICPWHVYLTYADKDVIRQQLESMKQWIFYMRSHGTEEFLWRGDIQFGDWLGLDAEDGSYEGSSDRDLIASAYYAYSTGLLIKMLRAVDEDTSEHEALYNNIVAAFCREYSECKTQTECALVLAFDLAQDRKKTAKKLADLIHESGDSLTTGFVGTPYLLEALSENGYEELAYSLLLREDYPSWLFSVNQGATTVWEHWDGIRTDGTMWSSAMNSFNHYAYGSVAAWMYRTMAGIRTDEEKPGFEHIILCPKPDKRLKWVKASLETKYGEIISAWKYVGNEIEYEFHLPQPATAEINGEKICLEPGKHEIRKPAF